MREIRREITKMFAGDKGCAPPLVISYGAASSTTHTRRTPCYAPVGRGKEVRCGRVVGEIGEAPPVAEEASRFRGSAPSPIPDSGRGAVGTTVSNRTPLRLFCNFSVGRHPCVPPLGVQRVSAAGHTGHALQVCFSAKRGCGVPHPVVRTPPRRRLRYTFPRTFAALR